MPPPLSSIRHIVLFYYLLCDSRVRKGSHHRQLAVQAFAFDCRITSCPCWHAGAHAFFRSFHLINSRRVRAGTSAHTRDFRNRSTVSNYPYPCWQAGAYWNFRPLSNYVVCVLARRRTRVKFATSSTTRTAAITTSRRVLSEALQLNGRSPDAYLREATVTGAFKRTC